MKKYNRKWDQEADLEYNEAALETVEEGLEADVRHFWQLTRRGPHDDCDCYGWYRHELKLAIKRLRLFRAGTYVIPGVGTVY